MTNQSTEVKDLEGNKVETFPSVRYGDIKGRWDHDAPRRVAAFILGFNPETQTTAMNERMWDVVNPITEFWYPERDIADLEIIDKISGRKWALRLGDHVGRLTNGMLRIFTHNEIVAQAFPGGAVVERPEFDSALAHLLKDYKKDQASRTSPELLAQHLISSLNVFNETMTARRRSLG